MTKIYVNGIKSNKANGFGAICVTGNEKKTFSGFQKNVEFKTLLLTAILGCINQFPNENEFEVYTMNTYILDAINMGHVTKAAEKGWKTGESTMFPNYDMWQKILDMLNAGKKIKFLTSRTLKNKSDRKPIEDMFDECAKLARKKLEKLEPKAEAPAEEEKTEEEKPVEVPKLGKIAVAHVAPIIKEEPKPVEEKPIANEEIYEPEGDINSMSNSDMDFINGMFHNMEEEPVETIEPVKAIPVKKSIAKKIVAEAKPVDENPFVANEETNKTVDAGDTHLKYTVSYFNKKDGFHSNKYDTIEEAIKVYLDLHQRKLITFAYGHDLQLYPVEFLSKAFTTKNKKFIRVEINGVVFTAKIEGQVGKYGMTVVEHKFNTMIENICI